MKPEDYVASGTAPTMWKHQQTAFQRSADLPVFALNFDTRCGKSRAAIDTAAYQYEAGKINAVLVVAYPTGVPRVWVQDEFPGFLPSRIPREALLWRAGSQNLKWFNDQFARLLKFGGLAIFAVNAEALSGKIATVKKYIDRFIQARKVFLIIDECDAFASPGSARSMAMQYIARKSNVISKRILSATIIADSPFEIYSQYNLLDRSILGFNSFTAFKSRYGVFEEKKGRRFAGTGIDGKPKFQEYPIQAKNDDGTPCFRNLAELQRKIAPYTMRVRRSDVSDAPAKIYQRRYFDLTKEQWQAYNQLRDEYRLILDNGAVWDAKLALTRLLRLQQITSNFLPERREGVECAVCAGNGCEACDEIGIILKSTPIEMIGTSNPRLASLMTELEMNPGLSTIIWARFTHDINAIVAELNRRGFSVARYDGAVTESSRAENLRLFQAGEIPYLVGNQDAGGRGVRMDRAELVIFYSNTFALRTRLQAEDRAEAIDKKVPTGIIDLTASNTVDEKIIQALRNKQQVSSLVTGDRLRAWL